MNAGEALPVAEFRLNGREGRRVVVRATGVRLDTPDGPAALSIFVDDTERKKAEDAVRRSEAMLSHLVATSPDVITLTDLATGRYAMVNRQFKRQTSYSARWWAAAPELGIWVRPQDLERFVAAIRDQGQVQDMPTEFATKGGGTLSMLVSGARFTMDRREYLVLNGRDVTEAERERLQREAILQNASIGIAVTRNQRFVLANPRFEQMYGWPPGTLIGQAAASSGTATRTTSASAPRWGRAGARRRSRPRSRRRFDGSSFLATSPARPSTASGAAARSGSSRTSRPPPSSRRWARARCRQPPAGRRAFLANTSTTAHAAERADRAGRTGPQPDAGEATRRQYLL